MEQLKDLLKVNKTLIWELDINKALVQYLDISSQL